MQKPHIKTVEIKKTGRFWAVNTDKRLLAIVLYKQGALAVQEIIHQLAGIVPAAPPKPEKPAKPVKPSKKEKPKGKPSAKPTDTGKSPSAAARLVGEAVQQPASAN